MTNRDEHDHCVRESGDAGVQGDPARWNRPQFHVGRAQGHLRDEFWIPTLMDRPSNPTWTADGSKTMLDPAAERRDQILRQHEPDWLDEDLQREIDRIVAAAERELLR